MNRDDIIRMAREAGCVDPMVFFGAYERFANLVAAAERERIITQNAPEIEKINEHIKALEEAVAAERDRCCGLIFSWAGSDNVAQRTVDAIRGKG